MSEINISFSDIIKQKNIDNLMLAQKQCAEQGDEKGVLQISKYVLCLLKKISNVLISVSTATQNHSTNKEVKPMKTFNSLEEIKPYYNEKTSTYEFVEDGDLFDVYFRFDMKIRANIKAQDIDARDIDAKDIKACDIDAQDIKACDINARDIKACDINARDIIAQDIDAKDIDAKDIKACDIKAWNINAQDISYWAVCFAQFTFKCKSIVGKRKNAKHFCLDSKIVVAE